MTVPVATVTESGRPSVTVVEVYSGAPGTADAAALAAAEAAGTTANSALTVAQASVAKANNGSDFADAGSTRANLHIPVLTPAAAAATANVASLSGLLTIDGYTLVAGDIALLTAQTTLSQNGPWVTAAGAWTRPADFAHGLTVKGRTCRVLNGTTEAGTDWTLMTPTAGIVVDTGAQSWSNAPDARYASRVVGQNSRVSLPGRGRGSVLTGVPNWTIACINLGIGPNTIDTYAYWTSAWNLTRAEGFLDKIAASAFNTVRIQGNYTAWLANPTQYLARFNSLISYCQGKGLKVIYCLLNAVDDQLTSTRNNVHSANRASYQAMIASLVTPWAGSPTIIMWDVANELPYATSLGSANSAELTTIASNMVADLKAVDPTTIVCASVPGASSGLNTADIAAMESASVPVDGYDMHIYAVPLSDSFHYNWFDDIKLVTSKPFGVFEFGANVSPSAGGPHLNDEYQQAAYIRALRRYFVSADCWGYGVWQWESDSASSDFGLFDVNGTVRQAYVEMLAFPAKAQQVALDVVAHRACPVALDDFARSDSSASLGTAPQGGAWTAGLGTWGLGTHHAGLFAVDASGQNVAVLDGHTADGVIEAEMVLPTLNGSNDYNAGIILRYTDSTHWTTLLLTNDLGGGTPHNNPGMKLVENNGGTFTTVATYALPSIGVSAARLTAIMRYDKIFCYLNSRFLGGVTGRTLGRDSTKHGLYTYRTSGGAGDSGTSFSRYSHQTPLREY